MAVLLAGLPVSVPATTVNRLCGSNLDAAMIASRTGRTRSRPVAAVGRSGPGLYTDLVVPVDGVELDRDEGIRPDAASRRSPA
jgi:hypothetical protein